MLTRVSAAFLVAALVLTGCSSPKKPGATSPTQTHRQLTSPTTGLAIDALPTHPAMLVKIENTSSGAPQYGVTQADLVVEELVEGGLTRLAAVFYTQLPTKTGHVRSARGTDVSLASPLHATIVASGAARYTYSKIHKAGLTILTEDRGAAGFSSDPAKARPYNRLVNLVRLAEQTKAPSGVKPYFDWSAKAGAVGKPVRTVSVRYSGGATTVFRLKDGTWRRQVERSAPGEAFTASNLVVVFAEFHDAGYRDPAGNFVPEATLAGSGKGLVVTGGKAIDVTWKKAEVGSTMTFTDAQGHPVTLLPGRTWMSLAPQGTGSVATG